MNAVQPGEELGVDGYALRAWGLLGGLRFLKARTGLTGAQLAGRMQVSASQLSRIENGKKNLDIRSLLSIARDLGLPLPAMIQGSLWASALEEGGHLEGISKELAVPRLEFQGQPGDYGADPSVPRKLRPRRVRLAAGDRIVLTPPDGMWQEHVSMISLYGDTIVEIAPPRVEGEIRRLLTPGCVSHFRDLHDWQKPIVLHALTESEHLVVDCPSS